jgi:hypothetical protein
MLFYFYARICLSTASCGYGFRARAFGASRNDEVVRERKGVRQCFRYPDVRALARGTV